MSKVFHASEVSKHNTIDSCWVVLYGNVYDVTDFLPHHPGGSKIILQLAGRDSTEDFDPIHPQGTLEEHLEASAKLGKIEPDQESKVQSEKDVSDSTASNKVNMKALLNLDEIEAVATKNFSKKAWAYYYSASDDLISKRFNNTIYKSIFLRPRVFVDCVDCDTSTFLLGHKVGIPIFVAPAAMARLGHPAGEKGIAQGVSSFNALQIISNYASMTPEQIVTEAAPSQMFGWQLYVEKNRMVNERMIAKIDGMKDKIQFICLTVDSPVQGKREDDQRMGSILSTATAKDSKLSPISVSGPAQDATWKDTLQWLAKHTSMPIVLKGIQTHEDAFLAMENSPQVKAIILSNHGGRNMDTAPPAVHTLLEIRKYCPEVFQNIEVWVDGGIKRGTDVVKALCLGARAVGVGRAALYGLGAGGPEGVERTFEILQDEMKTCMRLLGARSISELGPQHINARKVEGEIYIENTDFRTLDLGLRSHL